MQQLGKLTFPVVCEYAEQGMSSEHFFEGGDPATCVPTNIFIKKISSDVITVTDEEMVSAMRLLAERAKLVAEASAGAAVAAAIKMRGASPEEWGEMRRVVMECQGFFFCPLVWHFVTIAVLLFPTLTNPMLLYCQLLNL